MSFQFKVKAKKTPFQKQKESEERRRKRDEEENEKALEDFVKDFGVRQEVKSVPRESGLHTGRKKARPSVFESDAESDDNTKGDEDQCASQVQRDAPKGAKVRKMDILLENLKREQELRSQEKGDTHDSFTSKQESTNLVVKYLAPNIDESILMHEFGRFGPIASVKVMWPRDEEQRRRGWNTGFVAFMSYDDALSALNAMDGLLFHDHRLSMAWGEPVALPKVPIWPPQENGVAVHPESTRERADDGPPPKTKLSGKGTDIEISVPLDDRIRYIIDAMAINVSQDGSEFERLIMARENNNKDFQFLFDKKSSDHLYYRWRVWSLCNGDTLSSWRVDPFLMFVDNSLWIPPARSLVENLRSKTNNSTGFKFEHGQKPLSEYSRNHLMDLLKNLSSERRSISDAMVFVIDNSESCAEVTEMILENLLKDSGTNSQKLPLLNLISDVLYNTSAPVKNASQYRVMFQDVLPDIFEDLQQVYLNSGSRMVQEMIRKHVLRILRVWRGWFMFHDDFLNGLQAMFLRGRIDPSGYIQEMDGDFAVDHGYKQFLEDMNTEELENECKRRGVSRKGNTSKKINKLLYVQGYTS
jgi:U2-associated protein SR140